MFTISNTNINLEYLNDYWLQKDKELFSKLISEVFPKSVLNFLNNKDFGKTFFINEIETLIETEKRLHEYSFEFTSKTLRDLYKQLEDSLHEFNHVLLLHLFENKNGEIRIYPELEDTDFKFLKAKNQIHKSANIVCQKYDAIVKRGNNLLI